MLQAQSSADSIKQKPVIFVRSFNNFPVTKQQSFTNKLPADFYSKQLPFFCSKELQIQKAIGIPIKFRVGSVEYCDKLEGKKR